MEKGSASIRHNDPCRDRTTDALHALRRRCFASDGFDAVLVINGILINFSLYCNGALAGVLPLTVISYNTTGLLPFTLYMYMSSSHTHRHCTPVGTWCWASSVLQPACPGSAEQDALTMKESPLKNLILSS
ncbi:hypothetical protein EMCRGX_G021573 [Ephydatia muelleri]